MPTVPLPFTLRLLCALLLLAAGGARAETAADLYRALVPVTEQGPAELKRAAAQGLAEVLGRVSGRDDIAQQAALREPLGSAEQYIEQFGYLRADDGSLQLQLQFSPGTITGLLRGAGLLAAAGARQGLQLRVDGVENFADYVALLGYLRSAGSARAMPESINGSVVTLSVIVAGGSERFVQQLAGGGRLLPVAADGDADANTLRYHWQGRGG